MQQTMRMMYTGPMYICLKRGETAFIETSLKNGTCQITSHRLIILESRRDHFEGETAETREEYPMKDFLKASLNNEAVIVHFTDHRQAKLQPVQNTPGKLQEIKRYIEQIATLWNSKRA